MHLEKFYVDVVSSDGSGCIGYAATLEGFGFAATVASTLRWDADKTHSPTQHRTLRGKMPEVTSEGLTWDCLALEVSGTWKAKETAGAERTLWTNKDGAVSWQALAPRAEVAFRLGQKTLEGLGYAERLRLNLPPWQLPIDGMRWGRFVSAGQSVIWTDWEHPEPRRWLWHNGIEYSEFRFDGSELIWPGFRLALGESRRLRAGRLADTVFARWPKMQRWIPARIRKIDEAKWCARGTLTARGIADTQGWVIHEHVSLK